MIPMFSLDQISLYCLPLKKFCFVIQGKPSHKLIVIPFHMHTLPVYLLLFNGLTNRNTKKNINININIICSTPNWVPCTFYLIVLALYSLSFCVNSVIYISSNFTGHTLLQFLLIAPGGKWREHANGLSSPLNL